MRRLHSAGLVLVLAAAAARQAVSQEIVQKVRYKGGHAAWGPDEIRGTLAIGDTAIVFQDQDGKRELVIPIRKITDISNQTQRKEASVGSKLLFGGLARSRQEEFLTFSYELPDDAEAIIFRFEPNTAAAALAKIKFRMKKLGVAVPATEPSAPVVPSN